VTLEVWEADQPVANVSATIRIKPQWRRARRNCCFICSEPLLGQANFGAGNKAKRN
jgi:hypothetical protein